MSSIDRYYVTYIHTGGMATKILTDREINTLKRSFGYLSMVAQTKIKRGKDAREHREA